MDFNVILWIVIMVALLVVEALTMNLTTIWLAIGALASVFITLAGAGGVAQFAVFVVVSAIMVFFTRPLVKKYVAGRYQKTNSDSLVGRTARIIEPVRARSPWTNSRARTASVVPFTTCGASSDSRNGMKAFTSARTDAKSAARPSNVVSGPFFERSPHLK